MRETFTPQEADVAEEVLMELNSKITIGLTGYGARLLINRLLDNISERIEDDSI